MYPDVVIELRSETEAIKTLQLKMQEYIDNGVKLGWLIDPKTQKVEILQNPATLSGEDILPGFVLNLSSIFKIS